MPFTTLIDCESLAATAAVVLDCRFDLALPTAGYDAYRMGHIPGAVHADLNRDLSAPPGASTGRHPLPDPAALARRLGSWGIAADTQVVAYDAANGSFAARAWWLLRWLGHERVAVLDGGFEEWRARGYPVQTALPESQAAKSFAWSLQSTTVDWEVVDRRRLDSAWRVVDARAAERFAGAVEPIDPVAGHIPGAVNHPFSLNLAANGRFLPAAELKVRWQSRLGDTAPRNTIVMCGSGVTACHDLLALEVAGLTGAKLYPGSWSEWIRDPKRAVTRD